MKYKQIYKLLEARGAIDKALAIDTNQSHNEKKIKIIESIQYLEDFEKNEMMLRCEYWKYSNCNPIASFLMVEYCKAMQIENDKIRRAYDYCITVHKA